MLMILLLQGVNGTFNLRAIEENGDDSLWFTVLPQRAVNDAVISLATKQRIDFETTPNLVTRVTNKLYPRTS